MYTDSIHVQLRVSRSWKLLTSSVNLVTSGSCSVRTKFTISSVVYSPENTERPSSNWVKGRGREESGGRREKNEMGGERGGSQPNLIKMQTCFSETQQAPSRPTHPNIDDFFPKTNTPLPTNTQHIPHQHTHTGTQPHTPTPTPPHPHRHTHPPA